MNIAIITSDRNIASVTIRQQLVLNHGFVKIGDLYMLAIAGKKVVMHSVDKELPFLDYIDREIDADIFIFPSIHRSKAGVDAFTVHSMGNWGKAEMGGIDGMLCPSSADLLKSAFIQLQNNALHIDAVQEATHHGPYISKPGMFIEIGSDDAMYRNDDAGKIVADAIVNSISNFGNLKVKSAIGLGGTHYCNNFAKVMLNSGFSVAHVCPKHALGNLDKSMLAQAAERCIPKSGTVIVDWKGLGENKDRVRQLLDESSFEVLRTSDF